MIIVGLTGGIGSGKTVVCNVFRHLGIPVYEADKAVHRLYENQSLIEKLLSAVGSDILDKSGKINRKKLAEVVFNDIAKLETVNSIVHPAVRADFKEWLDKHKNFAYVIEEAAILFESGAYKQCDKTITVSSPIDLRIGRIRERDHKSKSEIEQIISKQLSEEERNSKADYIIFNDEKQMVIPQVLLLHSQFLKQNG
jgi:dephospho-CoA kinase